jgi:hypothetical protein
MEEEHELSDLTVVQNSPDYKTSLRNLKKREKEHDKDDDFFKSVRQEAEHLASSLDEADLRDSILFAIHEDIVYYFQSKTVQNAIEILW